MLFLEPFLVRVNFIVKLIKRFNLLGARLADKDILVNLETENVKESVLVLHLEPLFLPEDLNVSGF